MRPINRIFIHATATRASQDYGIEDVRRDHVGVNGWSDVGYHALIRRDGRVEPGRPVERPGAHVRGHNADSIGIALEGGLSEQGKPDCNYTADQWASLRALVQRYVSTYRSIDWIGGHRDVDNGKACPCFDAGAWAEGILE